MPDVEIKRKPRTNTSPAHRRWLARHDSTRRFREQERELLGDIAHVGHFPFIVDQIEGWTFRRCPCGFDLALSTTGKVYWIRKTHEAVEILTLTQLIAALAKTCRFHWIRKFDKPFIPQKETVNA